MSEAPANNLPPSSKWTVVPTQKRASTSRLLSPRTRDSLERPSAALPLGDPGARVTTSLAPCHGTPTSSAPLAPLALRAPDTPNPLALSLPAISTREAQELQKKRARRQEILNELLDTERIYVENLEVIIQLFVHPAKEKKILTRVEIGSLFSNVESLYEQVNTKLLAHLEALIDPPERGAGDSAPGAALLLPSVGHLFLEVGDLFKLYAVYCSNQPNIHGRIIEFKEKAEFSALLKSAFRNPRCRRLDLEAFLITPLQRLCKYPMLLKELLKNTAPIDPQHEPLQQSLEKIQNIVNQVNERVRKAENINKLIAISKDIDMDESLGFDVLADHNRVCHLDGPLIVDGANEHVYLFNDVLLLCENDEDTGTREAYSVLKLKVCLVTDIEDVSEGYFFEVAEVGGRRTLFQCSSKLNKKKWLTKLGTLLETLYPGCTPEDRERLMQQPEDQAPEAAPESRSHKRTMLADRMKGSPLPSPRIRSLWTSRTGMRGPSVRKIAQRFEISPLADGAKNDAAMSHIRKMNTTEKEKRIVELERFGNALKSKCAAYKEELVQERRKRSESEQRLIELEDLLVKAQLEAREAQKRIEALRRLNDAVSPRFSHDGHSPAVGEEGPQRKRSVAFSTTGAEGNGQAQMDVLNKMIDRLTEENLQLKSELKLQRMLSNDLDGEVPTTSESG